MSALKIASPFSFRIAPLLPVLCLATALAAAELPVTKSDVLGFWSLDIEAGLDIRVIAESYFTADGRYELRSHLEEDGEIERFHGIGTWMIRNDTILVTPNPKLCVSEGSEEDKCLDTTSDALTIGLSSGIRTLLEGNTEVGNYAGSAKAFTLPSLFAVASIPSAGRAASGSKRMRIVLSGMGSGGTARSASGFDLTGRRSGSPGIGAAGIRVRSVEVPER